jgi:ubiquinone/menaquinone biosynthesis C-methylase UbiE
MGTGVAEAMLKRLVEKAGNRHPFPFLLADATNLPLDDGSVDVVMACHVLT